jgi:hypothetical protein
VEAEAIAEQSQKAAAPVAAAAQTAQIEAGAYQASFQVPGRATVPQDGSSKTVLLSQAKAEPALAARIVPELEEKAYLEASFVHEEAAPLLPGIVALHRDGSFIGRGRIGLVAPGAQMRGGLWLQDKAIESTQAGALQVPPAADSRAGAAEILALPYLGVRDTRTQTVEPTDPRPSCSLTAPAKTVWWRVTAPAGAEQLEVIFQGQRYDTFGNSGVVVAAYPANGLSIGEELACALISRGTNVWTWGTTTFPVTPGAAYYILASATGLASTDGGYTILGVRALP